MRERLRQFMYGRYGADNLSRFSLAIVIICDLLYFILSYVFSNAEGATDESVSSHPIILILYWMGLIILIWNIFRIMSRNHSKRYAENNAYLRIRDAVTGFFKGLFSGKGFSGDKTHKVFKCPGCGQKVRVPKGKGRIAITCPKCKISFIKRT